MGNTKTIAWASALVMLGASSTSFAEIINQINSIDSSNDSDMSSPFILDQSSNDSDVTTDSVRPPGGGGHPGGGHPGGGHPGGGGHGHGHIGHSTHFHPGGMPRGGWRGHRYFYGGAWWSVWAWGPWAPWWGWAPYYGWTLGLGYYVPEGLKCYADNPQVAGEWVGDTVYYSSDDAINSALGFCENDPTVLANGASAACRIRTCTRW